jgi:hypothetical protein
LNALDEITRIIPRPLSAVATVNEAIDSEWNITTGLFGLWMRVKLSDNFQMRPNLISFNRAVVPYEISKVNFPVETKILVRMSEEI